MQEPVSPNLSPSFNPQPKGSNKNLVVILVILIAAVVAGVFFLRKSKKTETVKPAITETNAPSPTEKPKIDKKTVKIEVLNGTGTPGQAASAVTALEKAGYDASNIKSGNATDYKTRTTTITARTGFENIAGDVKDSLKSVFDEINIDDTKLDEKNAFDIIVTTGGKKFEVTPTPTSATPTSTPSAILTPTSAPTNTQTPI